MGAVATGTVLAQMKSNTKFFFLILACVMFALQAAMVVNAAVTGTKYSVVGNY